jgi:hypothetical protein
MSANESSGSASQFSGSRPEDIMINYQRYLPQYLQMNTAQVPAWTNAVNQAGLSSVQGAGGQVARDVASLTNQLNPALNTANQAAANANQSAITGANAANNQLNAINLNGLSPGEYNATERALNRNNVGSGNLGLLNPTNTIANAMNFGGAFNSKIPLYNAATQTALQAPTAFANAAGAGATAANANTAGQAGVNALANPSALGTTSALANTGLATNLATGNYSQGNSSNQSMGGGVNCCFIFMEAYYGFMPPSVRRFRDRYYRMKPEIAIGYKKMAKWLVPLMRRSTFVRELTWLVLINPATKYTVHTKHGLNKTLSHFWLKFWAWYGKY